MYNKPTTSVGPPSMMVVKVTMPPVSPSEIRNPRPSLLSLQVSDPHPRVPLQTDITVSARVLGGEERGG